ncbi:MAG TPA: hypothetical protein VEK79_17285 [Thermoanaerobaculia bacterium]|nr:hypothetical protein [Thermoanaerobaculia bacterium]
MNHRIAVYVKGALAAMVLLVVPGQAAAQCVWTFQTASISEACGSVGIGTMAPVVPLDVLGWAGAPSLIKNVAISGAGDLFIGNAGASVARTRLTSNGDRGMLQWNIYYDGLGYRSLNTTKPSYELELNSVVDGISFRRYPAGNTALNASTAANIMTLSGTGNVGIGVTAPQARLHVAGDARFTGTVRGANIQAHFQDVAEWVPATADLEPGTVVVLNTAKSNEVMASTHAYDTSVAGVVSSQPGIILGDAASDREQIATTGRVRVKVDARERPIAVGDLLVSSDVPGRAMSSVPMKISGRAFHQPGTIIGKALEPLAGGEGEILVLLSMQ